MLHRSVKHLLKHIHGVRYMAASSKKIDIFDQMKTYSYLHNFMFDPEDPIKKKWDMIKDWSDQCQNDPQITEQQFKVLRQRYELTPLYEDQSIAQNNTFLKDIFSKIQDSTKWDDKINKSTLTDLQFQLTKRIMNETISVKQFISKLPELMESAHEAISTLPYKKWDFDQFEKSVKAWATYKFLSYGHPRIVQIYQNLVENGGDLSADEIKDVVHYMKKQGFYSFHNKNFKEALKWFSRMNWVFDHPDIYQRDIEEHFVLIYDRYEVMKEVLEDEETLERCAYYQKTKDEGTKLYTPEVKDIEVWLKQISGKEKDPLIVWLKEALCNVTELSVLQNAIVNRHKLDIGGLLDTRSSLLGVLTNEHLYRLKPDEFEKERQNILIGTELTDQYLNDLKVMVEEAKQMQKEMYTT